jgi:hypothetical protein
MNKKITNISDLTTEKYLESIDYGTFYIKREYGTKVEIDGAEYAFKGESQEELDKLIEEKKNEIKSKKRDNKIDDIIK